MYDDVLAEPRLEKQLLLKCNPDHQMFPLPHHHHLTLLRMQLSKTQAQLCQLSPTLIHTYLSTPLNTQLQWMLFFTTLWTLLKELSPATSTHIKVKKFY